MAIEKNTVVSLSYKMYDEKNNLIDQTVDEPMVYLHGGYDGIFPVVEEALHGKNIGDTFKSCIFQGIIPDIAVCL